MKTTHKQRGGTLLGILIGIVIGVLISFGVVWTMNRTPLPFRDKGMRVERPANGVPPRSPAASIRPAGHQADRARRPVPGWPSHAPRGPQRRRSAP